MTDHRRGGEPTAPRAHQAGGLEVVERNDGQRTMGVTLGGSGQVPKGRLPVLHARLDQPAGSQLR